MAHLTETDLSGALGLTWEQHPFAHCDQTTLLPPDIEERRTEEQDKQSGEASPAD